MLNNILFSIITVTLNSEKTISQTVKSVLNQKYKNFEYIIVDGMSNDNTLNIIKKFNSDKIKIVSEKDSGCYDAMNKGIELAQGKWIHILNSDDEYRDEKALYKAISYLDENKLNYFKIDFLDINNLNIQNYSWDFFYPKMFIKACIPHPTIILSKKQYEKIGLYSEEYKIASDHDLTLRAINIYKPIQHNYTLVEMKSNGMSRSNSQLVAREFRDVTINNGLPKFLAYLIYIYRKIKFLIINE